MINLITRSKTEHKVVHPADVVLFEGILALYSQELREIMQMKIFVDTDSDTRLARRSGCGYYMGVVYYMLFI